MENIKGFFIKSNILLVKNVMFQMFIITTTGKSELIQV